MAFTVAPSAASGARQVLERSQEANGFNLAGNGRGDRIVTLPHDTAPGPTGLDVFSAPPGAAFGPPAQLSGTDMPDFDEATAVGPDGTVAVVGTPFTQLVSRPDRLRALIREPGGDFEPSQAISKNGADDEYVAFDSQGNATAIWVRGYEFVEASTRPAGGEWDLPVVISRDRRGAAEPQVAFDAAGDAVATWTRLGSPEKGMRVKAAGRRYKDQVVVAIRPADGAFGKPQRVSNPRFDSDEASLAVNAAGRIGLVWISNTPHDHFRLGAAFGAVKRGLAPPRFFTRARDDASGVTLGMDDKGRSLISWRVAHGRDDNYRFDIRLAHRPKRGRIAPAARVTSPHAESGELGVAPNGDGVIAWIHYGRRTSVLRARNVTTRGRVGRVVEVARGDYLDDLRMSIDGVGAPTFVWTHDTKRLEATTLPAP